jgi:hypothetical protein
LKDFNDEIISTDVARFVKRKMFDISFQFCQMTKNHMLGIPDIWYNNPLWTIWENEFSWAVNSGGDSKQAVKFNSRVDFEQAVIFIYTAFSQKEIKTFHLQENHQVWEAVWNIVDRELSAMSTNSANILLEILYSIQEHLDGQHIFLKICKSYSNLVIIILFL